jgi:triphosphoribosyl-dephospho-CoA synthase
VKEDHLKKDLLEKGRPENRSPDHVAQCAELAMLLELSSSPKPGNVDRCHDFSDIGFHHFLSSAVSAYPVFRKAASSEGGIGSLLLEGVRAWLEWNVASNTHFGSLVLMLPLAIAAAGSGDLRKDLAAVLSKTTVQDAIDFYRAFDLAGARVSDVDEFSLKDPDFEDRLRRSNKTLLDLMILSKGHDLVAREWATGYERSFRLSLRLAELIRKHGPNDGIVRTYLEALAEAPDSLVWAKFGEEKAREVSLRAGEALEDVTLDAARKLDSDFIAEDVNPGSTADLVAASLFICLLKGLRF